MALPYDTLVPYVAPEVPGCPDPVIKMGLKRAAMEFFKQSELWRYECDPTTSPANEKEVELDVPMNMSLAALNMVWIDGEPVSITHPSDVPTQGNWMTDTGTTVQGVWVTGPSKLRLWPIPTVDVSVAAYCSLFPRFEVESLDDVAYDYQLGLVRGALWNLQTMVGQPWSNPDAAVQNGELFNAAMVQAKIYATRHGMGMQQIRMRAG